MDEKLGEHIRDVLVASPWVGEGHWKVFRATAAGIRTSKGRLADAGAEVAGPEADQPAPRGRGS
jgi:hypothetical protein